MAVASSLFALCISAYLMRREGADWRPSHEPMAAVAEHRDAPARQCVLPVGERFRQGGPGERRETGPAGRGACTILFLAGQFWAWRQLDAAGYYVTANPANAFFYLLTALHGLHLLGGLWVWGTTAVRDAGAAPRFSELRLSVELCTTYWHFLLLVWLILFGLLLST